MKRTVLKRVLAAAMSLSLMTGCLSLTASAQPAFAQQSSISAEEFKLPSTEYRPGVRWWWSGGAVEEEELLKELHYLAENNFGMVEINPFGIYDDAYPDERLADVYTDSFYEKLGAVIAEAEKLGITVDLNMGSGWNANSPDVTIEDSMGNAALGRTTVEVSDTSEQTTAIPKSMMSSFYDMTFMDMSTMQWSAEDVKLYGVLLAKIDESAEGAALTKGNEVIDPDTNERISYATQTVLDLENSAYIDLSNSDSDTVTWTPPVAGTYEVIALYGVPSGNTAVHNADEWYVVDHLDSDKVKEYMEQWLGNPALSSILEQYPDTVRAVFNDSYEFYTDVHFNDKMYALAKDAENNGLGYDFTPYLATQYQTGSAAPSFATSSVRGNAPFVTYHLNSDEQSRVTYDYHLLINEMFQQGMAAFQESAAQYGLQYRQEAYNPPIDTIGSAAYVDIPEGEQANEMDLKRVSSGAHLYGRNLVTAEQYTLGCTPLQNTLEQVKHGYDLMATSGITNFFYHGFSYNYYGTEKAQADNRYGEDGWDAFQDIGINVAEENTLSKYFEDMNAYSARVNYLLQQGKSSADVAVYMPTFGSLSLTDAINALNANGYGWDAINDESIQQRISYQDGKIVVDDVGVTYDALLIQDTTLPVATMEALQRLAQDGAPIFFYGDLPNRQPSYYNGAYAEMDAQVSSIAQEMIEIANVFSVNDAASFTATLKNISNPAISYEENADVRFIRRSLDDGGELAYIRNTAKDANTITVKVDESLKNCYWLDQNTGDIYRANRDEDGNITITLPGSEDSIGGFSGKYYSTALALVCEPEGASFNEQDISAGMPFWTNTAEAVETIPLNDFTLTVTADNIGSAAAGNVQTKTYTGDVLGNWADDNFQNGELKYVVSDGIYRTTLLMDDQSTWQGKQVILDLGRVATAAQVTVNGMDLGNVMFYPYQMDITEALVEGENDIEIAVTPRKYNRFTGFGTAYREENATQYSYYASFNSLVETGLTGPVSVGIYNREDAVQSVSSPESAQVNSDFVVTVVTADYVRDVRLYNANGMSIGRKNIEVAVNDDGSKTWNITIALGTVGDGRTLNVVTQGYEDYLIDSGKDVVLDITSVPPVMENFDLPENAVVNRTFIVQATTDLNATGIAVYNENGMKMGIKSLAYEIVDGQKVWTGIMSIGTQGERTFTAYAVNKYGAKSDALTDQISVKAFA